ncbi:MAG: hypothetical protein QM785_14305 [Pyrinomonadaceae bacterium]
MFKIEADASQFEREARAVDASVGALNTRMESLSGIASLAGAAFLSVGSAALAATTAIFNLSKATSEYGSEIFDATEKTGLAAETISSLKVAADQSGSSLEAVTGGLSKFAKTIGEAGDGSEQAQAKLAKLGVTSTDLDTALSEALGTIAKYPAGVEQMTAAQAAFGKSGADLLPFIKSFDGNLPGLIEKCKKLGLTMSDENARASDEFGDTLDTLSAQAAATGRTFALELMPSITSSMKAISSAMAANRGEATFWAESLINAVQGVGIAAGSMTAIMRASFTTLDKVFGTSAAAAINWGGIIRQTLLNIIPLVGLLTNLGNVFGVKTANASMGGNFTGADSLPTSIPKATGGGGAGSPQSTADAQAAEAERQRKAEVDAARKSVADQLEIYAAGYKERTAKLENALTQGAISETEKIRDVARVRLEALMDERRLTEALLSNDKIRLNDEERAEIMQKIKVLAIDIRTETLKGSSEITAWAKKQIEDGEKQLKIEREKLALAKKLRQERNLSYQQQLINDREKIDPYSVGKDKQGANGDLNWDVSGGGSLITGIVGGMGAAQQQLPLMQQVGQAMASTFQAVASAVGSVVENFIKFGSAGTSFRKFATEVISSIAKMAIVQSIWEAAQGLAMLGLFYFTHKASHMQSAIQHFQSAATFGTIGGVAAVAGRGLAGNAFASDSGGSNGSGDGSNASPSGRSLSERFGGFLATQQERADNMIAKVTERTNTVLGELNASIRMFNDNFAGSTADVVVRRGLRENGSAVIDSLESGFQDDGNAATRIKRVMGDYRNY